MKKCVLIIVTLIMISSVASGFFGPKTPPPSPLGNYCSILGCNFSGDIYMNWNYIFDVILNNSILYNATIINGTFTGMVNYTQVANPIWVEISGDNMTGPLSMQNNAIYNISFVTADDWSNVTIVESQIIDLSHTVNTEKGTIGFYLYNDTAFIYFNETKLNQTIQALDTDTHISSDGFYLTDDYTTMYFNESKLNDTISFLDINTWWSIITKWLFNNSGSLDFNESRLNDTIDERDTDTHVEGDNIYLYNDSIVMYMNETKLNDTINANVNYSILNQTGCSNPLVACVNRENTFDEQQFIVEGFRLNFRNLTNNTYFYYNVTNGTLQLWVNGALQQDWGASTTVYGKATFLADAFFQNISGNAMVIDTNVLITGNLTVNEYYIGNGTYITDVCHSDGSGCGSGQVDTQKGTIGFYLYNDSAYIYFNETRLNDTINDYVSNANITINWSVINNTPDFVIDGDNIYLYKDNSILYLNETKLNDTIDIRDDYEPDTNVEGYPPYLYNDTTFMYFNETHLNQTIGNLDTDTQKDTIRFYLYNDSLYIYFNETQLNQTIENLDTDTTYTAGGIYIILNGTLFYLNESKLNDTIDIRDADTHVKGDNFYLTNDSTNMYFNESKLNDTIDIRDADTHVKGDNFYLTNDSTNMYFNESKLNDTIDIRDADTHVEGDNFYLTNDSTNIYFNESKLNDTIDIRDTDTHVEGDNFYLTNDSINMYFNESKLNDTIDIRDADTHVEGDNFYLTNDSTNMYFNESKLNDTIEILDTDTTYTNGTGILLNATEFSLNINYTDGRYYTQSAADVRFLLVTGGVVNGNVIFNGNFTLIGDIFNATVTNQFLNGSLIPQLHNIFNIGSSQAYWNAAYITAIYSNDWSNVSITESQITDLIHTGAGLPYLYQVGSLIYLNETKLNNTVESLDTNTQKGTNGFYLYNDSLLIYFNETKLNDTIDQRDTDTTYTAGGIYIILNNTIFYLNESKLNETITNIAQIINTDTHVAGDSIYLYNDSSTMYFNETKLNDTIDLRDDYEFAKGTTGFYLYNDSVFIYFNESQLNTTIELLDNDTLYFAGGIYLYLDGTNTFWINETKLNQTIQSLNADTRVEGDNIYLYNDTTNMYLNESKLNDTIDDRDTYYIDTQKGTTGFYLYNDSLIIYFNETQLNATIEALDTDTTYMAGGIYIYLNDTVFWLNETKLNISIDDYVTGMGLVNSEKEGAQPYLYNDSIYVYFNETKLNDTVQTLVGLQTEYINISVSGGTGINVTINCCYPQGEVIQVAVFPITSTNKYRFSANGTISGEVVDADRKLHKGDWIVGHDGITLANETISLYLTNVNTDELFTVRVRWRP